MKVNAWQSPGCDLSLLNTIDLLHFGLNRSCSVTDQCILRAVTGFGRHRSGDFCGCNGVADAGISVLGRCGQLQSIDLAQCGLVTDVGISVLGHECGQLRSINLAHCGLVTDVGISALGHGCGQLQSIDLTH